MSRGLLFLVLLFSGQVTIADCGPASSAYNLAGTVEKTRVYYQIKHGELSGNTFLVGESVELAVIVCDDNIPWSGILSVDATMPMHGHGTNYLPEVTEISSGLYTVEGLVLHMPGSWRLEFVLAMADKVSRIAVEIKAR